MDFLNVSVMSQYSACVCTHLHLCVPLRVVTFIISKKIRAAKERTKQRENDYEEEKTKAQQKPFGLIYWRSIQKIARSFSGVLEERKPKCNNGRTYAGKRRPELIVKAQGAINFFICLPLRGGKNIKRTLSC